MRTMLNASGQVAIPPESYVWPRAHRLFVTSPHRDWAGLAAAIIDLFTSYPEFPTWDIDLATTREQAMDLPGDRRSLADILALVHNAYRVAHYPDAVRWGDKTPINALYAHRLHPVLPSAHIVHMRRDPVDAVASYVRAGLSDPSAALAFWRTAETRLMALRSHVPHRVVTVRYEDLVRDPETELRRVCGTVGIDFSPSMLHPEDHHGHAGDVGRRDHHGAVRTAISDRSVGTGSAFLSARWVRRIRRVERHVHG